MISKIARKAPSDLQEFSRRACLKRWQKMNACLENQQKIGTRFEADKLNLKKWTKIWSQKRGFSKKDSSR